MPPKVDSRRKEFEPVLNHIVNILNNNWPSYIIPPVYSCTVLLENHTSPRSRSGNSHYLTLRRFVIELLRRSHTSMTVLLVALRYLETVRSQIFDLAHSGDNRQLETTIASWITVTTENVLEISGITSSVNGSRDDDVHVANITDTSYQIVDEQRLPSSLPPLPLLPLPLLCPRRTFISSIILATKFLHDKSYSNRAWATLCQLPPREISRCERALGNALQWRLWLDREYPLPVAVFTPANTPLVTSRSLRTQRGDTEM